ncbi:MAG: pseudouridine synthase [Stagnimonas sp.]|nr:pseudouridine synthase [Stagnimonas sp.]
MTPAPLRNGLAASRLQLPRGAWATVLAVLADTFPSVSHDEWLQRFARGLVLDADALPLPATAAYREGAVIQYYREVPAEAAIPFEEAVLHADAHLVVADKPHFLPVTPAGAYVEQTLLTRLIRKLGNADLVPLHRIDRGTAGLVLFSANPASRAQYQALFRERRISKRYEALAPPLPALVLPLTRKSRIVEGMPFFRMQEVDGAPNSETRIEVIEQQERRWRYALHPITGKKHQLRVHMAALGAPIHNDEFYPALQAREDGQYEKPLQLLAQGLSFTDPLSGEARVFASRLSLAV